MENDNVSRLLAIASPSLCPNGPVSLNQCIPFNPSLQDLQKLLVLKNGFFAFEGALHVFPASASDNGCAGYEMLLWNQASLWRTCYQGLDADLFFFAEDIFGNQLALDNTGICLFDAETGDTTTIAADLEEWSKQLLKDYKVMTGWPLANMWQKAHGVLKPTERLIPKQLFALGGSYTVDNLIAIDAVEGMKRRAGIATQIHELKDGTNVKFIIESGSSTKSF